MEIILLLLIFIIDFLIYKKVLLNNKLIIRILALVLLITLISLLSHFLNFKESEFFSKKSFTLLLASSIAPIFMSMIGILFKKGLVYFHFSNKLVSVAKKFINIFIIFVCIITLIFQIQIIFFPNNL
jgi:hypothetical protein